MAATLAEFALVHILSLDTPVPECSIENALFGNCFRQMIYQSCEPMLICAWP
jgi:hypothetical protein